MGFAGLTLEKPCQYLALLVVLAGLSACHPQTSPVPAKPATALSAFPTITPSALPVLPPSEPNPPHPTAIATAIPTPIPAPTTCPLIRADNPPRLDYPQDVAVSGDGQTLYITSRPCSDLYDGYNIIQIDSENSQDCIHRLYTLKDGKISAFPGQLMQNQGCYMSEIELAREENRLYISQLSSSKLLGFDTNTYQPNLDKSVAQFDVDSTTIPPSNISRTGPLNLYWDPSSQRIYFVMDGNLSESSSAYISTIFNQKSHMLFYGAGYFAIYKEHLYRATRKSSKTVDFNKVQDFIRVPGYHYEEFPDIDKVTDLKILIKGIRLDSKGNMYVSDINHHVIWKYDFEKKTISILAGANQAGFNDGQGSVAQFRYPTALDVDHYGNLYVADTGNKAIRKITPDGTVTTLYKETQTTSGMQ
jgi:DNA-binding beta-propeller fold protein YncE